VSSVIPIDGYFKAQQENRTNLVRLPEFQQLTPLVDSLYEQSIRLVPRDDFGLYGRVLLVCHSSFLSSVALIVQAQPHDAAPITRRAIEAIRLAAAVKEDRNALEQWLAYEKRQMRWQARQEGMRPQPLNLNLRVEHELVNDLLDTWGMLSDAAVHFTPEFLSDLSWNVRKGPAGREIYLNYFVQDIGTIQRDLILTTGSHAKMLRVLDWCWDGVLVKSPEWAGTLEEIYKVGSQLTGRRD
jgi:hypothetical protein